MIALAGTSAAPLGGVVSAGPATTTQLVAASPANAPAGVNWLQETFPSPCSDRSIQLIGGAALDGGRRVVLDDVASVDAPTGTALAFLSCRAPGPTIAERTVAEMRTSAGSVTAGAEQALGAGARIVGIEGPAIVVETPVGSPPDGSCCVEVIRRQTLTLGGDGFVVTDDEELAGFHQTVLAAPLVGADAELVRGSVTPGALCFRWEGVWLGTEDEPAEATVLGEPSAELLTIRLALIHVTGRWIDPASEVTTQMAEVVADYQQARGLAVDGRIGPETTNALADDLGCPDSGSFSMVAPTGLGPRAFGSVSELVSAAERFARSGRSGSASIDQLLTDARWDGDTAMFLGCTRWEAPATGLSCSWSGVTPLQLVGLVDHPDVAGLGSFSILYARSTAV